MRFVKPSATLIAALALWVASGPAAFAQAKPAAKKPAAKAVTRVATTRVPAPSVRRDPFQPLISKAEAGKGVPDNLPPGPGGLMVSTLRLDGIVRAPSGMIAVVSSPQQRVYFIREGTNIYDGTVEKISLDAVTFRERSKDAFGKQMDRQVVKRLYPRAGEQ